MCGGWISPGWCRGCAAHQVTNSHGAQMNNTELLWENESSPSRAQHGPVMAAQSEKSGALRLRPAGPPTVRKKGGWGVSQMKVRGVRYRSRFCTKGGNQRWWLFKPSTVYPQLTTSHLSLWSSDNVLSLWLTLPLALPPFLPVPSCPVRSVLDKWKPIRKISR